MKHYGVLTLDAGLEACSYQLAAKFPEIKIVLISPCIRTSKCGPPQLREVILVDNDSTASRFKRQQETHVAAEDFPADNYAGCRVLAV